MSLRELLSDFTGSELKDIARAHNFRGFSGLKREPLIELIVSNLQGLSDDAYKDQFNEQITDKVRVLFR